MPEQKKLFLLDAMALIYRAYFAFKNNPRINSKGLNTSAMMGFTNTVFEVLKNHQPSHIGIAFDTSAPTQRHEEFTEYKANREAMPEELKASIPYIFELCKAFDIPMIMKDGYEADDIIGTLAKKAEKEGFQTFMMTPDKDYAQLVSENIFMYRPGRGKNPAETWGIKEVQERFSVERPEQVIDILGLWGDSVDNIPGIPGIGEKRAKELVGLYGSVEGLLENTDKLKGKMKENVINFAEQGLLSKKLATIILDVPVELNEAELKYNGPKMSALQKTFAELEFRTMGDRILKHFSAQNTSVAVEEGGSLDLFASAEQQTAQLSQLDNSNYHLVKTKEQRAELLTKLLAQEKFCFDTETTSLVEIDAELVGIAFSWKEKEGYFLLLPEDRDECQNIVNEFKEIFENPNTEKVAHNIKYDIEVMKNYDIEVNGTLFDTMIAHYLLEPDKRHGMDTLAESYLDYAPVSIETLIGKKGKKQLSMRDVEESKLSDYACEDADITWRLKNTFEPMLQEKNLTELFNTLEMPLVKVLGTMERHGVRLDTEVLNDFSASLENDIKEIENSIYEDAGHSFNIASPKQLGVVLFEELKVTDKPKKTKTKQYSTSEDVLQKLAKKHPIIDKILEFRSLSKLKSTYVDALPKLVHPKTGKIHTSYNQAVAATGRLSSNNPNLQNIPIRTEKGREIRKNFIPSDEHHKLLAADYSQIELRLIAHFSQDENMLRDFNEGMDIHTATASRVYGVPVEEVTKEHRRNAKSVNFGIIYGISAFGLSENLGIKRGEAKEIIDEYFRQYPGIQDYMEDQVDFAQENGYVETILNRRRYLRDINSGNAIMRGFAERNAINAPIQGSSADMIKIAMINIQKAIEEKNMKSKMIMQVHDELVFDTPMDEMDALKEIVMDKMKNALELDVKVQVDMNEGNNWLEAH
jgi:DNA polymerase-1